MNSALACYVLSDPTRQKVLRYVNRNGCTAVSDLALAINGKGVDEEIPESHVPLLVDYGILERDDGWVYPTADSFLVTECLDSIESTVPESPRSAPVKSS
ncbi:helix-turn-helix transcriptional regulator [Natrinema thermotolerans]|uniref:Helix-turn-helix transcriptional regulator n=1 Tax=Natrinema thermotolerans TaxID=121872 RepID=A0AAF0P8A2_9EURY|nr:helix-turn-helix transcriptional regulator [Natrinema thermotolerans]QCC60221.1 ArsR family transcriptional regulator [Natrinema thermotolerans]QCC61131.1 ArsR family transcriptional regulator [Natrinema thermotolerans]WMT07238.1 helix-turn-helix transcriptional regulator [Natrinema thermotolerans]